MREAALRWNRWRYTLYAPIYDRVLARASIFARGRRRAHELAALQPGEHVLLVACGTGLDLELLPGATVVTAVDITPAMVEETTARAARLGRLVEVHEMDAATLDFPDAAFDCVMLHLTLAVVPDPVAAIQEASRVLRPGGRVTIFDKFASDDTGPSFARRLIGLVTGLVATRVTDRLAPLLASAGLAERHSELLGFGDAFRVALVTHVEVQGELR